MVAQQLRRGVVTLPSQMQAPMGMVTTLTVGHGATAAGSPSPQPQSVQWAASPTPANVWVAKLRSAAPRSAARHPMGSHQCPLHPSVSYFGVPSHWYAQ